MSNSKVNDFSIGDTNLDSLMLTSDAQRVGFMSLSLSEFDTDSVAVIEAGSRVEVGGGLYKITVDESISTTDPYTSATVADGTVYIVLQKNMGTASSSTTDATGYAIGSTTITLASAGTGTILVGDRVTFAGDTVSYEVTSGDADVSGGGSITIASPGIYTAIPSSATAITVSAGSLLASWTATAPVWRADYQGYYKTATVDRYIGGCEIGSTTTTFNGKFIYNKQDTHPYQNNVQTSTYITSNGTWTPTVTKYYGIWMTGKGGDGSEGTGSTYAGGGGGALTGYKRIKIEAGTTWTATFSASSGGSLSFTDGSTNLLVQNGFNSVTPAAYGFHGGAGGSTSTGMDIVYKGQAGQFGPIKIATATTYASGGGGDSFYGGGGQMNLYGIGESGTYGAGGAGGYYDGTNRAGGAGGAALIKIIG